jgi:hypothetical protein
VSFARQRGDITNSIITCSALKEIPKHQRRQRGVAASTATSDDDAIVIDQTLCNEEFGTIDTIININDAPIKVQAIAVGAAKAGTAAIVDVEDGDPAAGPKLRGQVENARG